MKYLETGSNTDITAQITGAGWTTTALAIGASVGLWVQVTPDVATATGTIFPLQLTAVSAKNAQKRDVVKAVTTK